MWNGKRLNVSKTELTTLKRLGEGTYGVVRKVAIKGNRQHYAYKQFEEPECQSCFRELYALSSLNHPSIMPLTGIVSNSKGVITGYLMPCASYSLMDLIRVTPPPSYRSCNISEMLHSVGHDIVQGIACLHQNAFLHRDIKPDNVLIINGHACISDFGLTTIIPEGPCFNTGEVHSSLYRAPELWDLESNHTCYGPEIDIYATGMTLLHMYLGAPKMSQGSFILRKAGNSIKPYSFVPKIIQSMIPFKSVPTRLLRLLTSFNITQRPSANELVKKWKVLIKYPDTVLASKAADSCRKGVHRHVSASPGKFLSKCSGTKSEVSRESYMISHLHARKPKLDLSQVSQIATQLVTYAGLSPDPKTWSAMHSLCKDGVPKRLCREPIVYTSDFAKYIHQRLPKSRKKSKGR